MKGKSGFLGLQTNKVGQLPKLLHISLHKNEHLAVGIIWNTQVNLLFCKILFKKKSGGLFLYILHNENTKMVSIIIDSFGVWFFFTCP